MIPFGKQRTILSKNRNCIPISGCRCAGIDILVKKVSTNIDNIIMSLPKYITKEVFHTSSLLYNKKNLIGRLLSSGKVRYNIYDYRMLALDIII